jgi:hypothetical protein
MYLSRYMRLLRSSPLIQQARERAGMNTAVTLEAAGDVNGGAGSLRG